MLKNSVKLTLRIFKLKNLEKYLHLNLSAVNMYAKLRNQLFFLFFVCLFCFWTKLTFFNQAHYYKTRCNNLRAYNSIVIKR